MKRHFLGAFEADDFGSWLSSFKERVSSIKRENEAFDLDFKRRKIRDAAKERIQHGFETIRREQPVNSWSHLEQNQEPESPSGTLSDTVQKYREHSLRLEDLEDRITEPHEQWRAVYVKDGDSQDFASIVIPTDKEEFESSEEAYENEEDLTDQGTRRSYLQDPVGTSEFIPATSSNDGDETDHIQDSIQLDDSETLCEQHHLVQPQKLSISSHIINLDSEDETDEVPDSIINTTAGYIEFEESSDEQSDSEVDHVEFDVVSMRIQVLRNFPEC
ncbi:hypothetical protein NEOLI_001770 [Neolecta irregularis DAH-3]|uniref:Uncharacterized protein n=1 Tax=Neolecta irregularis (strain DAH-3) TaxID=1198029 RepID=A0A1U7LIK2_NEOID|nr:hypothetical protein NEOLI_001770 [Neolecta irregularis DAH-3]|eukprot:OLL22423.1 hypothetical protein NEOLI_001770 [Neolecta irregularis DAH-3]